MIAFIANGSLSKRIRPDYQQTDNIMNPQVTVRVLLRPSRRLGQCVRKQQPITMTSHVSQPAAPRTWFARRRGTQRLFSNTTTSSSSGGGGNPTTTTTRSSSSLSVSNEEVSKFSEMHQDWWDPQFHPLIAMNPVRINYIVDWMKRHRQQQQSSTDNTYNNYSNDDDNNSNKT